MSPEPVKRIVVATDFSDGSDRALMVAIKHAKPLGAAIDLVHVYPMPAAGVMSPIPGVVPMPPPGPEVLEGIERRLSDLAAKVRAARVECVATTLQGVAAGQVVDYARRFAAEMIVTGTHGRTGVRRVLLGSVAEEVLRKARCPVLIVPPPREAE